MCSIRGVESTRECLLMLAKATKADWCRTSKTCMEHGADVFIVYMPNPVGLHDFPTQSSGSTMSERSHSDVWKIVTHSNNLFT
jgi:hypothetical protein